MPRRISWIVSLYKLLWAHAGNSAGRGRPSGSERRRYPRFRISAEVDFGSESNFFAGKTKNISEGGLFIETDVELPVGTSVMVDLGLMDIHATVEAEIMWVISPTSRICPLIGGRRCWSSRAPPIERSGQSG